MTKIKLNSWVHDLYHNKERYIYCRGGAGSGKSFGIAQKILLRITTESGHRFLCIRKVAKTLRGSIFQLFNDLIEMYDLESEFIVNKSEMRFTHIDTRNEILLAGIDDPEKLKSITGITSIWGEEFTECEEKDLDQLILRVRGVTENYKQFIFSFNPIDAEHWIKKRIETTNCCEIVTTYLNNTFLDQEYVDFLTNEASNNKYLYAVYVLGEWGNPQTGGEFYKSFDLGRNTANLEYDPSKALHITFDFNVLPYVTLCVWQIDGLNAYQIDEILAEPPLNSTKGACKLFKDKYKLSDNAGLFVYGDPSGKHRDTRSEQGYNDFDIIYKSLEDYHPDIRLDRSAPPVALRGQWINDIFIGSQDIKILISNNCTVTKNEYLHVKENADGGKLKERVKMPSGATFEKYGHTSDANDYFLCKAFSSQFNSYRTGNKMLDIIVSSKRMSDKRY